MTRVKKWQQENAERLNAYRRQRRDNPAVKRAERSSYLKRTYGISLEQYEAMLDNQHGGCGICGRPPADSYDLHVDHDHGTGTGTGKVRGLLCFGCNNSLGDFDDDIARLLAAVDYLRRVVLRDPQLDVRLAELKARRKAG